MPKDKDNKKNKKTYLIEVLNTLWDEILSEKSTLFNICHFCTSKWESKRYFLIIRMRLSTMNCIIENF